MKKKNIKEDELTHLLKDDKNKKEKYKNDKSLQKDLSLTSSLLNINNKEENSKDLKQYMIQESKGSNFIFFNTFLALLFPLLLVLLIIKKVKTLFEQEQYFQTHVNYEMVGITLNDLLLKVLQMQFQGNNLQSPILENHFNNSFEKHKDILTFREYDYNTFYIKFYQFYSSKIIRTDSYFYEMYKKKLNFRYPLRSGEKNISLHTLENLHISILLSPINHLGPIQILYNNSNIYFNQSHIDNSNLTEDIYYYATFSYIGFLQNFLTGYKYYNNEITNYFGIKVLDKKIADQKTITLYITITVILFICFALLYFILFYLNTKILFAKYLLLHTQLRFFNNYLLKKTILIYDCVDNNNQKNQKVKDLISQIKFDNDLDQVTNIKYIFSGQIEEYNLIKVRPLSIKFKGSVRNIFDFEKKTIIEESKDGFSTILQKSSFLYSPNKKFKKANFTVGDNNLKQINEQVKKTKRNSLISQIKLSYEKNNKMKLLKDKNTTSNRIGLNTSNRTNITNSTFNSSLNLVNSKQTSLFDIKENQYNQLGYKLMKKPLLYYSLFLILSFLGTILLIITLFYYKISINFVKTFNLVINSFRSVFANIKFICEMFIIFELSILENNPLMYEYESTQYSLSCDALNYIYEQNITTHEIFNELSTCFPYFKPKVDELVFGGCEKKMKNLIEFQKLIEGKNFCKNYVEFLTNIL